MIDAYYYVILGNGVLHWVTLLMIVKRERVATSVDRKVISRRNARRRLLVTIVVKQVI